MNAPERSGRHGGQIPVREYGTTSDKGALVSPTSKVSAMVLGHGQDAVSLGEDGVERAAWLEEIHCVDRDRVRWAPIPLEGTGPFGGFACEMHMDVVDIAEPGRKPGKAGGILRTLEPTQPTHACACGTQSALPRASRDLEDRDFRQVAGEGSVLMGPIAATVTRQPRRQGLQSRPARVSVRVVVAEQVGHAAASFEAGPPVRARVARSGRGCAGDAVGPSGCGHERGRVSWGYRRVSRLWLPRPRRWSEVRRDDGLGGGEVVPQLEGIRQVTSEPVVCEQDRIMGHV